MRVVCVVCVCVRTCLYVKKKSFPLTWHPAGLEGRRPEYGVLRNLKVNVNDRMTNSTKEHWNNLNDKWRENTVLIDGDSIISGLVEDRLSKNKSIKVRAFPGARINNFYSYLLPLLNKEPTKIIVHVVQTTLTIKRRTN